MRSFLGTKVAWPIVRATNNMAVRAVWMAHAPGANAHAEIHHFEAVGSPHQNALPSVSPHPAAIAAAYYLSAGPKALDDPCPEPGHDHADHIGCCGGMASCVSGGGAVIVPEEGPNLPPGSAILHFPIMPMSMGVKILPSDPPPRASI